MREIHFGVTSCYVGNSKSQSCVSYETETTDLKIDEALWAGENHSQQSILHR